jgi:hypothetical protein
MRLPREAQRLEHCTMGGGEVVVRLPSPGALTFSVGVLFTWALAAAAALQPALPCNMYWAPGYTFSSAVP